jgi:hypothetical protein
LIIKRVINSIQQNPNLTAADIKVLLREIIQRYCARTDHALRCRRFASDPASLDALIQALSVLIQGGVANVEIPEHEGEDLEVEESAESGGRRKRQATENFAQIFGDALQDPEATSGYSVQTQQATTGMNSNGEGYNTNPQNTNPQNTNPQNTSGGVPGTSSPVMTSTSAVDNQSGASSIVVFFTLVAALLAFL